MTTDTEDPLFWYAETPDMRASLREHGVEDDDIKLWTCPCGTPGCRSRVVFGAGPPAPITPGFKRIFAEGPVAARVVWVIPSISYIKGKLGAYGLEPTDNVDNISRAAPSLNDAVWLDLMLDAGLREVLAAEVAELRVS